MWPDGSLADLRAMQVGFDQGHQAWRADPVSVVTLYAGIVYAMSDPVVTPVDAADTYWVSERNSPDGVTVRIARPAQDSGCSIVEVADTR